MANFNATINQGSDTDARAAGFGDFADYQNKLAQRDAANRVNTPAAVSTPNVVDSAKQLQSFYQEANQPAVQTLQSQVDPLKQRYQDLLTSIKGQQTVAENRQTTITNNELGQRGILPTSGYYQQEVSNALTPIQSQFSGLQAQTGLAENQDLNSLANQIASLQAGNPQGAAGQALNLLGAQQQASQFGQQLGLQQQQQNFQQRYITIPGYGIYDTQQGKLMGGLGGIGQGGNQILGYNP